MKTLEKKDVIKLLPDSVANQIAAGEVIQRPASVIKELVENAIDAGARSVEIVIKDAGKTLIQVIDNGCGMSPTDARMAFERHATSKIRKADDLFTLHTMGFRGEALPSVAAVSEIEMRTMRPGDTMGTKLVIKASEVESQEPDVCTTGTNIMVKHLFYNFVARRRFLKKDSVELSHIMHEFERLVLVNTDVEFTLVNNGTIVHQLPRGPLKQRIGALFGKTVERQIIPVETKTSLVKIGGFIGLPSSARHRNPLQYFFVNGRNMRHPYFHKAVLNCYKDLIASDVQPNYFINFEVETDRIDVNIHPQKHEIKFEDEQMIWQVLSAAVKESLGKFNVGPTMDFDATDVPDIPPMIQGAAPTELPPDDLDPEYNPFSMTEFPEMAERPRLFDPRDHSVRMERGSALNNGNWEKLYETFKSGKDGSGTAGGAEAEPDFLQELAGGASADLEPATGEKVGMESLSEDMAVQNTSMFQLKNRWIVTTTKSGLMFVDQHRAHVKVLYEKFLPNVKSGDMAAQHLIFPEKAEVDGSMHAQIQASLPLLNTLGFELEESSPLTWTINSVPAGLGETSPGEALMQIVADLADTGSDPTDEQRSRVALAMAKAAAVRNNQPLTGSEQQRLVSDLLRLKSPNYTPDGQTVIYVLTAEQISSFFHR